VPPTFFEDPAAFRAWLVEHHEHERELWVGFHRRDSGRASITWPEAVDQALCFGWIDGVRKRVDDESYTIRFTPRRPSSRWSAVNVARVGELERLGLMRPAGRRAFAARRADRTGTYSYEQRREAALPDDYEQRLRANAAAWAHFSAQAPWYRRAAVHWVMEAKRQETRERRMAQLIERSAKGEPIGPLRRPTTDG
jgi:uncharacterized protein YdeI (YjbR/CyaY-like superfamily)